MNELSNYSFDPSMSPRALIFVALASLRFGLLAEEPALPVTMPNSRYEALKAKNPFAVSTPVATPAPTASFAANWYVGGLARVGDQNFVTIMARDLTVQFTIFGEDTNEKYGVKVESVAWSDLVGKSTVILRKGTETAKLEFNEAQIHASPPATAANSPKPAGPNAAVANSTPKAQMQSTVAAVPPQRPPNAGPIALAGQPNRQFQAQRGPLPNLPRRVVPVPAQQ